MTIAQLRTFYPSHDFYYFKDGKEACHVHYHDKIKGFEDKGDYLFIYMA